ncbi:hypothetical protein PHK61_29235 [Actinomycetospora lutea]|uniref:hypothetical protein n=1 Tax=Actinomycetospora lutea TaxID=663604 RepID=UPI0023651D49|nr:hypothetical protein [Actinomycetospora lutea]MDD7942505.1 hypothetical protein [Actinomycetospora lutea]
MSRNRSTTTVSTVGLGQTAPLLLGTELVRSDVATTVLGLALGDVPCGGPVTWALFVDAVLVGRTDEALTDEAAQAWARRMLGDGVRFQLAHRGGGYWLAEAAKQGELTGPRPGGGGWSR